MTYLIWYNPSTDHYKFGTEMDYNMDHSLADQELTLLYELDKTKLSLVKKIVKQLNSIHLTQESQSLHNR